jgi:hypothetical protein
MLNIYLYCKKCYVRNHFYYYPNISSVYFFQTTYKASLKCHDVSPNTAEHSSSTIYYPKTKIRPGWPTYKHKSSH